MKLTRTLRATPAGSTEPDGLRVEFDQLWTLYPRHVGKKPAWESYRRVRRSVPFEEVMAGARRYAVACVGSEQRHVAHLTTWLNQHRWQDEEEPAPRHPGVGHSARWVLEREVFPESRVGGEARALKIRNFLSYLMPLARGLNLRGVADDGQLAYHVGMLMRHVEDAQAEHRAGVVGVTHPRELLWLYLTWLTEHDWAATARVISPDSPAFTQFLDEQSRLDDLGRDQLTGGSRY